MSTLQLIYSISYNNNKIKNQTMFNKRLSTMINKNEVI